MCEACERDLVEALFRDAKQIDIPLLTAEEISDIHLKARIEWQNLPQPKPSLYDYQDQKVARAQLVKVVAWLEEHNNISGMVDIGQLHICAEYWQYLKGLVK